MEPPVAKMMNELGEEAAKLHETAIFLLRRRHWPICNGFDFLNRNQNFTCRHMVAKLLHDRLKNEEKFRTTQLQAPFLATLKHKTKVLKVFLKGATVDTNVVEVNGHELV
jgi:hypothetical protein